VTILVFFRFFFFFLIKKGTLRERDGANWYEGEKSCKASKAEKSKSINASNRSKPHAKNLRQRMRRVNFGSDIDSFWQSLAV